METAVKDQGQHTHRHDPKRSRARLFPEEELMILVVLAAWLNMILVIS
ncbi:MAG: hypothetical protein KUG65_01835 [Sphingomonadaceae bacterium]|nr:hypothetical protein [Sphingomonadaceae bacterium]